MIEIWSKILAVLVKSTPLPKPLPILDQTQTTSSFVNSLEQQKHVDAVLKKALSLPVFYKAYLSGVNSLEEAGAIV